MHCMRWICLNDEIEDESVYVDNVLTSKGKEERGSSAGKASWPQVWRSLLPTMDCVVVAQALGLLHRDLSYCY